MYTSINVPIIWGAWGGYNKILRGVMRLCEKVVRGAIKIIFRKNLGFWPNQRTPPPPPRKLGRQKKKKKFNVYFTF